MSLLLNALKKAEEGEKPAAEQTAAAEGAAATPEAAAASPAPALAPAAPAAAPAPAPAATVDFDTIVDDSKPAAGTKAPPPAAVGAEDAPKKSRVGAARVFGAGEEEEVSAGGGIIKKVAVPLLGIVFVGGGGYYVLESGLIPGVNLDVLLGLQSQQTQISQPVANVAADLEVSDDIVLLPNPAVDVQSKVDFASLQLPDSSGSPLDDEEYVRRVAFLTGFDINEERERVTREQNELIIDLNITADEEEFAVDAEIEVGADSAAIAAAAAAAATAEAEAAAAAAGERPTYTAAPSREEKAVLDATTPSDRELNFAAVATTESGGGGGEGAAASAPARTAQATQVEVNLSQEGLERQRMIKQARALYHKGNYLEAEAVYRNVLLMAPTSRDALRGLAQIAVVTGRYQTAVATYLDLLSYYPNDPVAIAELTNFRGDGGNFYEVEKALKGVLGKVPSADGRLYFSLGNLYAQNGKLLKAQQAYFDAFSRETSNPDYAYNLAVILDHLNKPALALRYYEEAINLSEGLPVGFNRAEVKARINDLN